MKWLKRVDPALLVAFVLLALAIGVLNNSYTFAHTSGLYPRMVGWIFVGLTAIEVLAQLRRVHARQQGAGGASGKTQTVAEVKAFAWLGSLLLSLYLLGFLISTPLYVFAYIRFSGRRRTATSVLIAAGVTAFVYLLFVRLLAYKLYAGVLLG